MNADEKPCVQMPQCPQTGDWIPLHDARDLAVKLLLAVSAVEDPDLEYEQNVTFVS